MARVGEYKDDTNLRAARENLTRKLRGIVGLPADDLLKDIEHLIDAKIDAWAQDRWRR